MCLLNISHGLTLAACQTMRSVLSPNQPRISRSLFGRLVIAAQAVGHRSEGHLAGLIAWLAAGSVVAGR